MKNIMVFGATGLLGSSLVPALRLLGYNVITQSREAHSDVRLNPLDGNQVVNALSKFKPSVLINLIAATNVDQCEMQPSIAWKTNAGIVSVIADSIKSVAQDLGHRPHLVHISTDQIYQGRGPHGEEVVDPINVYGMSKYTGELLAERVGATVLRTNFYGRSNCVGKTSFSDWLIRSFQEETSITVFDDVVFSAVHLDSLIAVIERCISIQPRGSFNFGCRDSISKAQFAFQLAKEINLPTTKIKVGSSTSANLKAPRPLDMSLRVSRIEEAMGIRCPNIMDEIKYTAMEYFNA